VKKINREDVDDLKDHLQDYASRMSELLTEEHITWADLDAVMQDNSMDEGSSRDTTQTMSEVADAT
jgi:hypothetical protein